MYLFNFLVALAFLYQKQWVSGSTTHKNFIAIPLVKHLDASGARILQEAVKSGELTNKSSLATTLEDKFKDDKYLQHYGKVEIGTPPQKLNVAFNPAISLIMMSSYRHKRKCSGHFKSFDEHSSHSYREVGETLQMNNGTLALKITKDTFHLGKLHIFDQYFGLIYNATCEEAMYDGVIGLGFSANYLTFLDNLVKQQSLNYSIAGLYLDRNLKSTSGGEVDLGYWNPKLISNLDSVNYIPIVDRLNPTWVIRVDMAFIGKHQITFDRHAIIDLNSYFIDIPFFEAQDVAKNIGAYNFKGNLIVDCDKVHTFPNLTVRIESKDYILEGKDYVDTVNSYQGHCIVLIRSSDENNWTLGGAFLGKYYTIFHYDTKQIAFANLNSPKSDGSRTHAYEWYMNPFLLLTILIHLLK